MRIHITRDVLEHAGSPAMAAGQLAVYRLDRSYNWSMVVGSYFIAILGAYTATQLMCQVAATHRLWKKLSFIALASVSLGGTGIWAMHFVKMLAMDIGIPVSYNPWGAFASYLAAVTSTFLTLAYDLLIKEITRASWPSSIRFSLAPPPGYQPLPHVHLSDDSLPLLPMSEYENGGIPPAYKMNGTGNGNGNGNVRRRPYPAPASIDGDSSPTTPHILLPDSGVFKPQQPPLSPNSHFPDRPPLDHTDSLSESSETSISGSLGADASNSSSGGYTYDLALDPEMDAQLQHRREHITTLIFGRTSVGNFLWSVWFSLTRGALTKGIILGLTVCGMHYAGMLSMRMDGRIVFTPWMICASASMACLTCVTAIISMPTETNLFRQSLFSLLGPTGISAMHFLGIYSGTFYTSIPPPRANLPVPSDLPLMILIMAVTTYLLSYAMLAHLVTQSRDRLAETIFTKRRLWKAIAEKEAFERANTVKSEFISVASHEIRTPLHAISGYTDLLLHTQLTEEQATFLEAIRMGCHSIQLITNNVLDFSKLEQDSRESNARPVEIDIRSLALRVVQSCATPHRMSEVQLRRLASHGDRSPVSDSQWNTQSFELALPPEKHVELLLVVEEGVPGVVRIDEVYITRVVMNLISNALKFTEDGYVFVRVTVEEPRPGSSATGPVLAISVRDSGIGIPADCTSTIFEPFRQADTSLTRSHTGAGLGLAISRQLCARMGGTIDLWTRQGVGSEFTVRIPALEEGAASTPERRSFGTLIPIAMAVRSAKTFELLRGLLEKRGFSVRAIDLSSPLAGKQPALLKPERLWIDLECMASVPWLFDYMLTLRDHGSKDVACFVIFDDVGTDMVHRAVGMLKDAGRIALVRRPIVLHDLIRNLRLGIPRDEPVKQTSSGRETPKLNGHLSITNGSAAAFVDTTQMTPLAEGLSNQLDGALRVLRGEDGQTRHGLSKDQLSKALNPLESVIHDTVAAARAKRVRFESGQDGQDVVASVTMDPPRTPPTQDIQTNGTKPPASVKERRVILLVEDNLVNQKLGIRLLNKLTYECDLAENGKVALDLVIANKNKYGLVLMDCQMPIMNGFECTRRIRALESSGQNKGRLPIIALTANVSSESRTQCQQAGADHFLPKPLLMQDLKEAINHYLPPEEP